MSGPWEQYQTDGPWTQYQTAPKEQTPLRLDAVEPLSPLDSALSKLPSWLGTANVRGSAIGRLAQGAADPGVALTQLAANALSPALAKTQDGRSVADVVNQGIASTEQQYQDARAQAGSTGFDPLRLAGGVGITAPVGAVKVLEAASPLVKGLVQGAAFGSLEPVSNGGAEYWTDKAKQVGVSALAGGITAPIVNAAAKVIAPKIDPKVAALQAEGVNPTVGQQFGGVLNRLEEKAQSLPIVGDAITGARKTADEQFRQAAINRAAAPIGEKIQGKGYEAIAELQSKIGAAYDDVLPKLSVNVLDQGFVNKLANLRSMAQSLPEQERKMFDGILDREISARIAPNGVLSGQNLKDAWIALRETGSKFARSQDAYQADLGGAIKQVFAELKTHVERTNPAEAVSKLKNADLAYANFKRLQRAASSVGAEDGAFSAAQLNSAVKAMDKSKDKAQFAKGDALMQDLSNAGRTVLTTKYPDSGTAGRWLLGGGLVGLASLGGAAVPAAAAVGAGALAYNPKVQNALAALLLKRPASAPRVANSLRKLQPGITAAAAMQGGRSDR